jgi:uncharacterized protein YbjQ (UPF0145 family)
MEDGHVINLSKLDQQTRMHEEAIDETCALLAQQALDLGANGIVGLSITWADMDKGASVKVCCYGTAILS